ASGQRLSEALQLPADRAGHTVRVHLRTREATPQEASAEVRLRYLPPPPKIEFDSEWLRQNFGEARELRKAVRAPSFKLQAQVVPAAEGGEVEVSLQQNQKPPIALGPTVSQEITLDPGVNNITLLGRNKGAVAGFEEPETSRQTLVVLYEK